MAPDAMVASLQDAPDAGIDVALDLDGSPSGALPGVFADLPSATQCSIPEAPESGVFPSREDVAYGPDKKQTLDIAWPRNEPSPLVVIIHGGGWTSGDKKLFHPTIRLLAQLGYAAATINYRLAQDTARAFPMGVQDVTCALAWLTDHASSVGADPSKTVLIGASAGGHLAALVGLSMEDARFYGACDSRGRPNIRGIVSYYGPLELRDTETRYPSLMFRAVEEFFRLDAGTPEWEARAKTATPATHVDANDPPLLLIHGLADTIVPPEDSRLLARAMKAASRSATLVELAEEKHGFQVLGRRPALRPASCGVLRFLAEHLGR